MTYSQRRQHYIDAYKASDKHSVSDQYKKPSWAKREIEQYIINQMNILKGHGYKVLSGNCFLFVAAYRYKKGKDEILVVLTKTSRFEYKLNEGDI